MRKIIVLCGISNSGKSTFAATTVQHNPEKYITVNRDSIRQALFSYTEKSVAEYYTRPDLNAREKQVTKYEDVLINEALNENKTVIVDATHLSQKYLDRFRFWNVPVEVVWFDITLKEALIRNMGRDRKVDEKIIEKQYGQYLQIRKDFVDNFNVATLENDPNLQHCILVDLDGTLAHMSERSPFDWKRVKEDSVDIVVKKVSNAIVKESSMLVFICTGRDGVCLNDCIDWLDEKHIYYDKVFIRRENDMRPDWEVKEEIWRQISKDYYIAGLIDDRQQVVRRARALGLKVFNVEYNNF